MKLTNEQKIEYLHRSYTAVDGLWFMKVEQEYDFDTALEIDERVWRILPKIQARKLRELTGQGGGLTALYECFTAKLELDRLDFTAEKDADGKAFTVSVNYCPWLELLRKSGREHLAEKIGSRICNTEYGTWAEEFGPGICFEMPEQICKGDGRCVLRFIRNKC